jgi:hypothetical protein
MNSTLTDYKLAVIERKLAQDPHLAQASLMVSLHFISRYGFSAYYRHRNWINCILFKMEKEILG